MFHKRVEQGKSFEFSSSIHWLSITSLEVAVRSSSYPAAQCVCLQTKEILHRLAISTFCQQCGDPSEAGGWEARPQLGINCTAQCAQCTAHWPGDRLYCTMCTLAWGSTALYKCQMYTLYSCTLQCIVYRSRKMGLSIHGWNLISSFVHSSHTQCFVAILIWVHHL